MRKCWTHNSRVDQAAVPVGSGAWPGFEVRHNRAGTAGVQGTGGSEGPGCGARERRQSLGDTKSARNFPRSLLKTAQKRCNSNDANSNSEIVTGELRAKLLSSTQDGATHSRTSRAAGVKGAGETGGPGCGARGRRRGLAGQRVDAPSQARGADGSRAGRRPRRSPAQTR